ncbi:ABC transporter permease subunit [Streptomyces sp. NBC_00669]|uniref:ABC transporter permease n=1 Tax=unclassified Streptomyces TaxID=2593676 RepID=UPI002E3739B6|nr:ABC transporter permease subunit [Streptomyces sp. NBC_00669]
MTTLDQPAARPPSADAPPGDSPQRASRPRRRRDMGLLWFLIPGIVVLLLFQYIPLLGNVIAFQDYQPYIGIMHSRWSGLQNFDVIFNGDQGFLHALVNTLELTLIQVIFVFPAPVLLALALNSLVSDRVKKWVQNVLYLPHFLSWVVVVALFQQMLGNDGMLNLFLRAHEMGSWNIIGNPDLFKGLLTSQVIWKDTGWGTILFLAALSRVDNDLYEAAAMDGASRLRQTWHVTLPALRGLVILLLILRLGDALSVGFEQILLQQGGVGLDQSEVLDTYVYNNGLIGGQWGVSAAVGLVKGIVGVVLVLGANKIAHLFGEEGVYQS